MRILDDKTNVLSKVLRVIGYSLQPWHETINKKFLYKMIPRTIPGRTNNNFSLSGLVQELLYKFSCIQVCQENSITKENNDFKQKIHNLDRHDLESKRSISLIYIEFKDQNNFQLRINVCSIRPFYVICILHTFEMTYQTNISSMLYEENDH